MDDKAEKVALFRYGLIAPLVLETLPRGELTRRAQQIAARLYDIPHSTRRQVSVDTLLDWTLRYRRNGLEALSPKPRQDRGQARAVATDTAALIERLKRENPHRTGAALLRELATASEAHRAGLSASTLYRFLRARGLTERQLLLDKATAHKKYEAEFANQIWQSDMLFGPWVCTPGRRQAAGLPAGRPRRRQPPHPARPVLSQPGTGRLSRLPAPGHRRPRHPHPPLHGQRQDLPLPAVGPHRRFHRHPHRAHPSLSARRTRQDRTFLPFRARTVSGLARSQSLLSLEQLNERLWHWLDTDYHRREHSSLQTTPLLRWQRDIEQVRQLPPATDLRRLFFHRVDRLVRRDSTFLLQNRFFEAPSHLAGKRIEVRFDPLDLTQLEIYSEGKPEGRARLVDAVVNGLLPPWETEEK